MNKLLSKLIRHSGLLNKDWENTWVLDKPYKVIRGSMRAKADKDDAWLFELSGKSRYIFDVGCNIGQAALMMMYHKSIEKIILVDPNPSALAVAAENLIHNNLSMKAGFVTAFISDKCDQMVEFYTINTGAAGSRYKGFAKTAAKNESHYEVNTLTIDYIADFYKIMPDLVKIDVEGAEIEVLKGATGVASEKKTTFFVEIHSGPELSIIDNTQGVLDWCAKNSYIAWYLKDKNPLNVEAIKSRGRYHALLVPKDKKFPEALLPIKEYDSLG